MEDIMQHYIRRAALARAAADERTIRNLLERWVSELPPAVAYQNGEVIGLTLADAPVGSKPFILRVE